MPTFEYRGHPVFYTAHGPRAAGRVPLVLVHGAGGTHLHWPPQVRRLASRRVYALDLPGHGQSAWAREAAPTPLASTAEMAAAVAALLDHLQLQRAVVAGHSLGSAVALALALDGAGRVAALALLGAGARLRVAPELLHGLRADFAATVDVIIQRAYGPQAPEPLKRLARARMLQVDPQVLLADWLACDRFDVRDRLKTIQVPALIITGSADQMTPEKYARYLAAHLPQAELCLLPEAGHMVMLERPEEVAQRLAGWPPAGA